MRIFITGVSSGIGHELTKLLIQDGHEVWGIARRQELLEDLKTEINSDKFNYSVCDVSSEEDIQKLTAQMEQINYVPDIVVLNSAVLNRDLKDGFDFAFARKGFEINYNGAMSFVEKFLPQFLERGYGKFVAVSSTSAFRPDKNSVSLPASKAAFTMAFRSLRLRYNPEGIKFTTVFFGPVATAVIPEYTTAEGQKKYFFVMSSEKAAEKLKTAVFGRRQTYYFPFLLTLAFRILRIFPDSLFGKISQFLKKK